MSVFLSLIYPLNPELRLVHLQTMFIFIVVDKVLLFFIQLVTLYCHFIDVHTCTYMLNNVGDKEQPF